MAPDGTNRPGWFRRSATPMGNRCMRVMMVMLLIAACASSLMASQAWADGDSATYIAGLPQGLQSSAPGRTKRDKSVQIPQLSGQRRFEHETRVNHVSQKGSLEKAQNSHSIFVREKRSEDENVSNFSTSSVPDEDEKQLTSQKRNPVQPDFRSEYRMSDKMENEVRESLPRQLARDTKEAFTGETSGKLKNKLTPDSVLSYHNQVASSDSEREKPLSRHQADSSGRRLHSYDQQPTGKENGHSGQQALHSEPPDDLSRTNEKEIHTATYSGLLRKDVVLREHQRSEPEHRNYHEDLLLRRMRAVRLEERRRMKNKMSETSPEDEDGWEHELRVRRELAEKAIEYGLQQYKERLKNPDPNRQLSILERIQQDAEEILRRRKEESQRKQIPNGVKAKHKSGAAEHPEEDVRKEAKEGANEEGKEKATKEKKKTPLAIRNMLNLKVLRKESPSSVVLEGNPEKLPSSGFDTDHIMRVKRFLSKGKAGRHKQKRRK